MPSRSAPFFIALVCCLSSVSTECPRLCECKWKNGKESVICLNANLSFVPLHLEAGTQVLDLTGNNIASIKHDEFSASGLLNLQKIYLSKCRLKILERYAFRHLKNLVELDLSYNVLSSVPSHTLDSIPELREIKLSGNPIQRVSNDAFQHVPQLVRLEMTDCRINKIDPKAFHGLESSLEWLKLDKNRLTELKSTSITRLQSLNGLELAGNPWNCSCSLRSLREWMLRRNVPYNIPPLCQYPKRLYSKTWDKLDLDEFACVPEIFAYDSTAYGVEGRNVTMTCRITGIPEPNVRWLLRNKVIANLSGPAYSNGKKLYVVHSQSNASDLTIFSADLQDAGVYVCAAENKAGKVEASVTLAVSKKPPESHLSGKVLIASILTGVILAVTSCLISLCVCSVRKRQEIRWRSRQCRREETYEKIELNHKLADNSNGGMVRSAEIAVVAHRKHGDYSVVPNVDTDQEVDEEEVSNDVPKTTKWIPKDKTLEKRWNSPEHLLDPEDLHIPRRTLQEARDDFKKITVSTSGTYNKYHQPSTSSNHPPSTLTTQTSNEASLSSPRDGGSFVTTYNNELSSLSEMDETKIPDLIENSNVPKTISIGTKSGREGGSAADFADLFCTLPRKKGSYSNARYRSTDSETPLLTDSRYESDSNFGSREFPRRSSDSQKYSLCNLNRNRVNQISNSYLNLSREPGNVSLGPDYDAHSLNVSTLENRVSPYKPETSSPTAALTPNANSNSYDYHAAQLERFLEEYRTLQKQLTKMKETCDNLRHDKTLQRPVIAGSSTMGCDDPTIGSRSNSVASPNSNSTIENSIDFRNFESELTRYLLTKRSSPKSFNNADVFNN